MAKPLGKQNFPGQKKWEDDILFDRLEPYGKAHSYRLIGNVSSFGRHWVKSKPEDPNSKSFPRECTNYNPETELCDLDRGCPICALYHETGDQRFKASIHYLINAINREMQQSGVKYPVRVLPPLPPTVLRDISQLATFNQGNLVTDPKVGRDIWVTYDPKGTPKWKVQCSTDGVSPLTPAEQVLEMFDFERIYPDFSNDALRQDYNLETRTSLKRTGYYGRQEPAQAGPSTGPAVPAPAPSSHHAVAAPPPIPRAATAAAAPPPPAATAGVKASGCVHPDPSVEFGHFAADSHCFTCPKRQACVVATTA